ncbi:MAG: hypothetical protein II968_07785 [Selenomonadaceae bacterium]|nr:hypothetical protein [Selenomonadaceae bacterium]
MELKQDYASPRWTNEILDCSMPMTFDTYSKCSYHCLYCFSFYQKSHTLDGYDSNKNNIRAIRSVKPQKVIHLFESALSNDIENSSATEKTFFPYIQERRIMQWGGLADAFDEYERQLGITLELLKYFDSIDYPLSFSTKAAWWTNDNRYMDLFKKHTHNWHVKVSIITTNVKKARAIEKGCPTPQKRLEAIKRLADAGIHVTLRLRPYIIGISGDWKELISQAHAAGADSVTVEFFCMEGRADTELKLRYDEMSKVCGFNIWDFYMHYSKQQGYKRLSRAIKAPIIYAMRDFIHGLGMRFHVSDMFCRECNDACNCCGVPPEWNVNQCGHIGEAILIAREKGFVRFSDIADSAKKFFANFGWCNAPGYNINNSRNRALYFETTMFEYIRNNWNKISSGNSPARGYGGILIPYDVDECGDVIYKYNGSR